METKDPALTKTHINSHETLAEMTVEETSDAHDHHAERHIDHNSHEALAASIVDHTAHHSEHLHNEPKGTRALQETVVGSNLIDDVANLDNDSIDPSMANRATDERIAGESVTHEEPLRKAVVDAQLAQRDVLSQDINNHDSLDNETSVTNNTDTFDENRVGSEHVNEGDNPARQPDRRDQEGGTAFDEGINEDTVGSEAPKSDEINDMNRYSSVNNAQSRILNPDEKD